jgi:hypothetical protein
VLKLLAIGLKFILSAEMPFKSLSDSMLRIRSIALLCAAVGAATTLGAAVQAQGVAKADAQCRLLEGGNVIYDDDCTVKEKMMDGKLSFVVKFDNGRSFRFVGPNRQNLRVENDFGSLNNVLFEDKGNKGVFSWNDGNLTRKLTVNTGAGGSGGSGLVLGPPVPDLQYLVGQTPVSAALGFIIRGTKFVSESKIPEGTLTYMTDKKRCVAFLSENNRYKSITLAEQAKCGR